MATSLEFAQNGQINGHVDGHKDYGEAAVKALVQEEKEEETSVAKLSKEHGVILKTFRILIADLCEQFGGGHPGSAIGMAAIGVALWKYTMQYAPHTPDWLNRGQLPALGVTRDMTNTEDVNAKMRACGFDVIDIEDGCFDVEGLTNALHQSRNSSLKPTFINVKTIIGLGSARAGDAEAHGIALGAADVADMKRAYSFDPEQHLVIGQEVRDFFEEIPSRGESLVEGWKSLLDRYSAAHPELADEFLSRIRGELPPHWKDLIPKTLPSQPTASRKANGLVFNPLAEKVKSFMIGTADLSPSVNMIYPGKLAFQHPDLSTTCGINGSYSGRYIHFGIREHAMASISNGLAAFSPNTIIPITSSFFMFYIYAAPGVRMGALQRLQVIHVATHDSIGMGEDGPTHQPIELAALYRAMPNLLYIRPGDNEEVAGAWLTALEAKHTPSIISTSRHALPQLHPKTDRNLVRKGAYVLHGEDDSTTSPDGIADLTLISSGAELPLTVSVASSLRAPPHSLTIRVVSFSSHRLFSQQPRTYQRSVLQRHAGTPAVVIEAYASLGWERYADAGYCMGTERFGQSLPGEEVYRFFGFTVENLVRVVGGYVEGLRGGRWGRGEWVDLAEGGEVSAGRAWRED
ncbi:MAG: hypothetical protein Q9160_000385 [Pyrenula sp. 1 TL-2023]